MKWVNYSFEMRNRKDDLVGVAHHVRVLSTTTEEGLKHRMNVELRQWLKEFDLEDGMKIHIGRTPEKAENGDFGQNRQKSTL